VPAKTKNDPPTHIGGSFTQSNKPTQPANNKPQLQEYANEIPDIHFDDKPRLLV